MDRIRAGSERMTADLVADHPRVVFPLLVSLSALAGAALLLLSWRGRRHVKWAAIGAVAGTTLMFTGWRLLLEFRMNQFFYTLQDRTGYDVSSYTVWTVEDDVKHQLREFRGQPILLYLWATTCGPCRPALPVLKELASVVEGRAVVILLSHEDRTTLLAFAKRQPIPAMAAYAPEPRVAPGQSWAFPQAPTPTTFLVDGRGVVRKVMVGSRSGAYLRAHLEELVASGGATAVQQLVAEGVGALRGRLAPPPRLIRVFDGRWRTREDRDSRVSRVR
jgi:thiol-disulfide isomerase/thioredoxin